MKISYLKEHHIDIYHRVLEECLKQGIDIQENLANSFYWHNSKEGDRFWADIDNYNFERFYKMYPRTLYSKFYNTTNIKGEELKVSKEKAIKQDVLIYNQLPQNTEFSAWTIFNNSKLPLNTPITSVRRALNSLEAQGKIEKFGKRKGALGKTENTYKLIV